MTSSNQARVSVMVTVLFITLASGQIEGRKARCGKGELLIFTDSGSETCAPCPTGSYMDYPYHRSTACFTCTTEDANSVGRHKVWIPCSPYADDGRSECEAGTYRVYRREKFRCKPCRECPFYKKLCTRNKNAECANEGIEPSINTTPKILPSSKISPSSSSESPPAKKPQHAKSPTTQTSTNQKGTIRPEAPSKVSNTTQVVTSEAIVPSCFNVYYISFLSFVLGVAVTLILGFLVWRFMRRVEPPSPKEDTQTTTSSLLFDF